MNWLAEKCREHSRLPAIFGEDRLWSYGDILEYASRLPDSPVLATWLPSRAEHAVSLLAALARDIPVAPILHRLPMQEAVRRAQSVGARWLLTPDGPLPVSQPGPEPVPPLATLLWTSGSTGVPRCIAHTLCAHLASAAASSAAIPLRPGARWAVRLPLGHISGLAILFRCAHAGAAALFGDGEPTHTSFVPTQLRRCLPSPSPRSLEALLLGGAPADPRLVSSALHLGWPVHLTYGLTEMASQVLTTGRLRPGDNTQAAGRPVPGAEIRLRDGRIEVRGPMLAAGEWTPSGLRPLADADGWFRTSDLARPRPGGSWQIIGRADRVIISGGENISPEPIEAALEQLPGIERAIIIAVPNAEFGQRPVAFLRGSPPDDWKEQLRACFPAFALPDVVLPLPESIAPGHQKLTRAESATLQAIFSQSQLS